MLVYGVGKPLGKKNDKFENALIENEKLLESIMKKRQFKETYSTINANTLSSITLDTHPTFLALKAEIESFNQEIKDALASKAEIPNYNWKHSLYVGLRNLLKEIVSTEDKNLKEIFLEKAKFWFFDRMEKKGEANESKIASRPQTNQSLRPITAGTRPFTAMTRPFTSQTNRISEIHQETINGSFIPQEGESIIKGKSFFEDTRDEILPSKLRANILKDYEDGARSKHDFVEPPYERLSEYERKIPQGILKPISRAGNRPQTSKVTTFAQNTNFKFFMDKTAPQGTLLSGQNFHDGMSQLEGSHKSQDEEGEGDEGEEGEGEGDAVIGGDQATLNVERKPGIVVPKRKLYLNDKITASIHKAKDLNIPIETRSNFAHYVPSSSLAELQLEQRWRNAMNKKTVEKREKEEFVTLMKEWAHTKSKLEEEISRRNESTTFGSRFKQRTFIPRAKSANFSSAIPKRFSVEGSGAGGSPKNEDLEGELDIRDEDEISEKSQEQEIDTPLEPGKITIYRETGTKKVGQPELYDFSKVRPKSVATGQELAIMHTEPLEDKMNKAKIDKITRLHADLLFATRGVPVDIGQDDTYSVDRPQSLSIYDQNKKQMYRPFSAVHQVARPENFRKSQMQEIEEVKAKLAKFKIKVPVKQLKTSLLLPEVTPASNPQLPIPGAGLLINPFFKEKKGKKKGGKKKKR